MYCELPNRGTLSLTGEDRVSFLQGLVTNDVTQATEGTGIYACLLSAQGRFLHDMFIVAHGDALLIDCEAHRSEDLLKRLKMFKLRARVELTPSPPSGGEGRGEGAWSVTASSDAVTDVICIPDPRTPKLGYRCYQTRTMIPASEPGSAAGPAPDPGSSLRCGRDDSYLEYDRLRISLGVPDGSRDMPPGEALLLENNIDDLHGIAWGKGCYIGQELTARMKYKAQPKKRLTPVRIEGPVPSPGTLLYDGECEVGEMRSNCSHLGLVLLRVDAGEVVTSGDTQLVQIRNCHPVA